MLWYEAAITQILSPRLDGDSDGDGNDLLYGVLDEESVLESDFPERFVFSLYVVMGCYFF